MRGGELGRLIGAKCFYFNARPSIGKGMQTAAPEHLDFTLWQGPAPERPFRDNLTPYNWHFFWHWGTAELGNNGVHFVDLARWGLGVDYPHSVVATGGKFRFDDDQETPDTTLATFDFGDKQIVWENRSWAKRTKLDPDYDVAFFGEKGSLAIRGGGYAMYDLEGAETARGDGDAGDAGHFSNFLSCIREAKKPSADIEAGHLSTLLCHLGNISQRVGRTVKLSADTHRILDDPQAAALWTREYRTGWEPG